MIFRRTFCRAFITLLGQLKSALQNDDPSYIACVRIVISGEDLVFPITAITAITRDHGDSSVSPRLRGRCCVSDQARLRAIPCDLSRLPRRSRGALPWITGDLLPSAYSVFQRYWGWFLNFGNSGNYGISSFALTSRL